MYFLIDVGENIVVRRWYYIFELLIGISLISTMSFFLKDLLRQLQQASRRMATENGSVASGGPADCLSLGSLGSQGGSCGSLDTAGLAAGGVTNAADQLSSSANGQVCGY